MSTNPSQTSQSGNLDISWLLNELPRYANRVCEVYDLTDRPDERKSAGTGFLIGPDLIFTSYHVIEALADIIGKGESVSNNQIEVVFPQLRDATTKSQTHLCHLAKSDWNVANSLPGPDDEYSPENRFSQPTAEQLDFALLRLDRKIGLENVDFNRDETPRGWFKIPDPFIENARGKKILVLHNRFDQSSALKLVQGEIIESVADSENARVRYVVEENSIISGGSGAPCLDLENKKLMGLHCGRIPQEESAKNQLKEFVPIGKIFGYIQKKDVELAHTLRYESEATSHKTSHFVDEVPPARMAELLRQNEFLQTLHTAVKESDNTLGKIQRYHHWMRRVVLDQLKQRIPLSDERWKYICFNQHIKLLGVPDMPSKFQTLFESTIPLADRNSIKQMQFSANQLAHLRDSIADRLDSIKSSLSDKEQKKYKEELIGDIKAAIEMSHALNKLIERYKLDVKKDFGGKIQERAEELCQYISELPMIHQRRIGTTSEMVARVGNTTYVFSKTLTAHCNQINELINAMEKSVRPFSLN